MVKHYHVCSWSKKVETLNKPTDQMLKIHFNLTVNMQDHDNWLMLYVQLWWGIRGYSFKDIFHHDNILNAKNLKCC